VLARASPAGVYLPANARPPQSGSLTLSPAARPTVHSQGNVAAPTPYRERQRPQCSVAAALRVDRVPQFIAVTWLALMCALAPANAEKRIALVVGNGAYRHADRLTNPVNDARGMRDALTKLRRLVRVARELLEMRYARRRTAVFKPE
jgi:Caspase domain